MVMISPTFTPRLSANIDLESSRQSDCGTARGGSRATASVAASTMRRSADLKSAVSPKCIRHGVSIIGALRTCRALRIENPRLRVLKRNENGLFIEDLSTEIAAGLSIAHANGLAGRAVFERLDFHANAERSILDQS